MVAEVSPQGDGGSPKQISKGTQRQAAELVSGNVPGIGVLVERQKRISEAEGGVNPWTHVSTIFLLLL